MRPLLWPGPRPAPVLKSAALALVIVLGLAARGRADDLEEFGYGARAQGMGGAFTALASDHTATYYNPGGLVYSRHLNLSFGFSYADYQLDFDSQRGGALDDRAERIPPLSALSLGVSSTIPIDVPDRLGFGLALFLPTRGLINLKARASTTDPEWFRYGSRHDRVHILAALGVKVTDWLSVGAGASIFVDASGGTTLSAGLNAPVNPEFKLKLEPDAGVVLGLQLSPTHWLSFGVTYRSEVSFKLDFPAAAVVQGINIPLTLETITFFTPHQVQAGVTISPTEKLLVSLDLGWFNWSAYHDPFLVTTSSVAQVIPRQRIDFDDVISPKLGVEYVATDWLTLRGGYWYRTSAVRDQNNEPTNLAGSAKHVFTLGVGFTFGTPPEERSDKAKEKRKERAQTIFEALEDFSFDLDLFFQYHLHEDVSASRPATDPIGSWDAGGGIVNFGFMFTGRF
ncbi:MAG: OmpP1/FadL family transporter [Planctomycetota bacterium]